MISETAELSTVLTKFLLGTKTVPEKSWFLPTPMCADTGIIYKSYVLPAV